MTTSQSPNHFNIVLLERLDAQESGPKTTLQQLQRRLLYFHHSMKCPYGKDNRCNLYSRCWETKRLWKHLSKCKNSDCRIPNCLPSKSMLSHYANCNNQTCSLCCPVDAAINLLQINSSI